MQVFVQRKLSLASANVRAVATKSFGDDRNEALRRMVRRLIDERFGTQRAIAEAMGVTGTAISDFLSGKKGAGMQLIDGLRAVTGASFDAAFEGVDAPTVDRTATGSHRDWAAAEAELVRRFGDDYPEDVRAAARQVSFGAGLPEHIDWRLVKSVCDMELEARRLRSK